MRTDDHKGTSKTFNLVEEPQEDDNKSSSSKSGNERAVGSQVSTFGKASKRDGKPRRHRTHPDAFAGGCEECKERLEKEPDLEAKALFEHLRHKYPGRFRAGQLRTFQWRVRESKEVYFEQVYRPRDRAQSDFTSMNALNITIQGEAFDHLVHHSL